MQEAVGVVFPPPAGFAASDVEELETARKLLAGEEVLSAWTASAGTVERQHATSIVEEMASLGQAFTLVTGSESWLEYATGRIPLGRVQHTAHSARLANADVVRAALAAGGAPEDPVRLEFAAANTTDVTLRLDTTPASMGPGLGNTTAD